MSKTLPLGQSLLAVTVVFAGLLLLSAHAAGAQGWYLLTPPVMSGTSNIDLDAPYSTWTIGTAFDTAAACEEHRKWVFETAEADDEEKIAALSRKRVLDAMLQSGRGPWTPSVQERGEEATRAQIRDVGGRLRANRTMLKQLLMSSCISAADPRLVPKPAR